MASRNAERRETCRSSVERERGLGAAGGRRARATMRHIEGHTIRKIARQPASVTVDSGSIGAG